jgi:class 3 adenylate cyclase
MTAIRYVRTSDGVDIAYQVIGDGPHDLVVVPQIVSHLEFEWEHPSCREFYERIASAGTRVIRFDKRGMGMSDRIGDLAPTIEQRIEDITAVMGATGSSEATVLGISEGGTVALVYAATYPALVPSLVLCGTPMSFDPNDPDTALPTEMFEAALDTIRDQWGTGGIVVIMRPSAMADPIERQWWGRLERLAGTPKAIDAVFRMNLDLSVDHVLPLVRVPALLVYREHEMWIRHGEALESRLPSASLVRIPGPDHIPWLGDGADATVDAITTFLTGRHPEPRTDRALATVLFTDVSQSTARTADVGDRKWRSLLDALDAETSREVANWSGKIVKQTGDGHLATFVGPTSAIRCASAIRSSVRNLGIEVRSGLHSGEVELRGDDVSGIAVNIANRVSSLADAGEILVSRTVTDLVAGSGLEFDDRGEHELKGVPGRWQLYAVRG